MERRRLADSEIPEALASVPKWERAEDTIHRTWKFDTYSEGVEFVTKVAALAEEMDHHPDLLLSYGRVTATLSTHDLGGLSTYDFALAAKISAL
jgi:4a-hydroxytetrahydrobiopterin dehydratase